MTQQYPPRYPTPAQPDPHQWQQMPAPKKKRKWPWVVGALVLLFAFTRGGDDNSPNPLCQARLRHPPADYY